MFYDIYSIIYLSFRKESGISGRELRRISRRVTHVCSYRINSHGSRWLN